MRITESQLRTIVGRLTNEAPLADLYPPTFFQKKPVTGKTYQDLVKDPETGSWEEKELEYTSQENPKAEKMKSLVSSPVFRTKLEKLTSSMNVDFYVAPYVAQNFNPETFYDLDLAAGQPGGFGNRAKVGPPKQVLDAISSSTTISREDKELFEKTIQKYLADSGGGKKSCLIIPILRGTRKFEFFTPWMIFHTLFDRGDDETYFDDEKNLVVKKNITGSDRLRGAIRTALSALQSLRLSISEIESLFTMGSARSGWFTRHAQPLAGAGGNTVLPDLANEAAVQALTAGGFKYNKDVWAEIERKKASAPKSLAKIKSALDRAEAESEKTKVGFMKSVAGKVVIVQGTRDAR